MEALKRRKYTITVAFATVVTTLLFAMIPFCNSAKANTVNNASIGYSVSKIPSKQEINSRNSFYDLKVKPDHSYTISARIFNATKKKVVVSSDIFTTYTNDNGQIEYTNEAKSYDKSLKNKVNDFVHVYEKDKRASIPAHGSRVVHAVVRAPKSANGVMLGSWYFSKNSGSDKKAKGISINNRYAYAIAIKMTSTQQPHQLPNLHLLKVKAGLNNYRKVVYSVIQNDKPTIIKGLSMKSTILSESGQKMLSGHQSNIEMAPNSTFNYSTFANDQQLPAGKYTMLLTATWQSRTWNWRRNFTITDAEANQLSNKAKNDAKPPVSIWWYVAGGVIILILLVLLVWGTTYIVLKRREKKE